MADELKSANSKIAGLTGTIAKMQEQSHPAPPAPIVYDETNQNYGHR